MAKVSRRKIRWLFRAVLAFFWVFAVFACLEVWYRVRLRRANSNEFVQQGLERYKKFNASPESACWDQLFWSYKKNAELRLEVGNLQFHIKINSRGLRSKEIQLPKPAGTYRILCIGGSTTVEGLTNETTYPSLLEKKLNRYFKTDAIEVINGGISGLNSRTEKRKFLEYIELKPDLVIQYNAVNDICWGIMPAWRETEPSLQKLFRRSVFINSAFNSYLLPKEKAIEQCFYDFTIANVFSVVGTARRNNIDFVTCTFAFPDFSGLSVDELEYFDFNLRVFWRRKASVENYCRVVEIYNRCLREMCRTNNVLSIPVGEELKGGTNYFYDICHMTPKGIEAKADIIAAYVRKYLEDHGSLERALKIERD